MKHINKAILAENIESRMKQDLAENNVSGASCIVKQAGEVMYRNHFGTTSPENDIPVSDRTMFRLASMTKPITGIAIMILVDRGLLSVDDEIKKFFPQFSSPYMLDENQNKIPVTEKITIKHLLTHTSGIGSGKIWKDMSSQATIIDKATTSSFLDFISKFPLSFVPGVRSEYSAVAAFSILVSIVEKLSGKDFESFLKDEIFIPCGMVDTTFAPSDEQWSRMITMHNKKDGKSVIGNTCAGFVFENYPPTNPLGGGGLVSSLDDYTKFADMLLGRGVINGKRIVSEKSFEAFSTPQISEKVKPGSQRWGLTVRVITDESYKRLPVGSFGWSGAYGTHFWIDPRNEIVAIYMKNSKFDGGSGAVTSANFEKDVTAALM